jgi:LmbE family N-acetylglucosaminyl deacetylase
MSQKTHIIVAHPDDETIFFGGLVLSQKKKWHIICVTDGDADGKGAYRKEMFNQALKRLKATGEMWDFSDTYEKRLPIDELVHRLKGLGPQKTVYTHGPLGDYGHPHHQDVCMATHLAFKKAEIWSPAYNFAPQKVVKLAPATYKKKCAILWDIYNDEIKRFLHIIPATWAEGFTKFDFKTVEAIYSGILTGTLPTRAQLKEMAWLHDYLQENQAQILKTRPF